MLVFGICILALALAAYFARSTLKQDKGTAKMQEVSDAIREGAEAFIKRQYTTIAIISLIIAVVLYALYVFMGKGNLALTTSLAFLFGAFCSAIAGIVGMYVSVRANLRTAAAVGESAAKATKIALHGGAVSALCIMSLSLLGVSITYVLLGANPQSTPYLIVGFGFGASLVALFAQLGGGIYTKAADIGADLVGKIEANIPEDDPRNPAVIADLVGDNVGDCAGRGADLFESTAAENIGAMILGVAIFSAFGANGVLFPLVGVSLGVLASMFGIFFVQPKEHEDPMSALNRGYYATAIIAAVLFYFAISWLLNGNMYFYAASLLGIVLSVLFLWITQYYTDNKYRPVKEITEASRTGAATNIIQGISVGFECVAVPVLAIAIGLLVSFWLGTNSGVANGGLYATAIATIGMLATAAYVLAMDNFGPIADNAGGIIEMSGAPASVRKNSDRLDAVGNTTKALTKGYAIGTAALAAFLLFSAYMDEVTQLTGHVFNVVNLSKVEVFVGAMLGAMLVYLFTSLAIRAVSKTAQYMVEEVRRQFKNKGILEGKVKPDYAKCVDITTLGALKNMVLPGLLAILFPVCVGFLLKYEAMAAFLMVGTIAGILMALFLNNAGGAWDNAKKYIETGVLGGKGSDAHKAAVVGDMVGDPFKDTAGPSLHVLIKLLATVTLVLAPLFL
ncbi:K(+)-stimulated pyrophosphate-energized sodium pump [Candidatus Anstonella stagnisolia]|nr:K(+)-stimulated pyrophosphate-energized sodium pump [Candidatus Anstonella stagnisolia]